MGLKNGMKPMVVMVQKPGIMVFRQVMEAILLQDLPLHFLRVVMCGW
jgi:hypothetical protein